MTLVSGNFSNGEHKDPPRVPLGLGEHSFPWGAGLEGTAYFLPEPPEAQQALQCTLSPAEVQGFGADSKGSTVLL